MFDLASRILADMGSDHYRHHRCVIGALADEQLQHIGCVSVNR